MTVKQTENIVLSQSDFAKEAHRKALGAPQLRRKRALRRQNGQHLCEHSFNPRSITAGLFVKIHEIRYP